MMFFHSVDLAHISVHMQCLIGVLGEISVADVVTFKGVGVGLLYLQLMVLGGCGCLVSDLLP